LHSRAKSAKLINTEHDGIIVLQSALKREFGEKDIAFAVEYPLVETLSSDGNLIISSINGVLVEILGYWADEGFVVFHCMKCRKKYLNLLESYYG
jgi:hypothetical protein